MAYTMDANSIENAHLQCKFKMCTIHRGGRSDVRFIAWCVLLLPSWKLYGMCIFFPIQPKKESMEGDGFVSVNSWLHKFAYVNGPAVQFDS